jgi:NADPH-dependent 2,4-dienoyl-CoA reductase/sulfur reductase-like enzyme/bacterioferritin-associated ferredoxin
MADYRINEHPILSIPKRREIVFYWNNQALSGFEGETIAAALFAHGVHVFGHHPKDNSPQGLFCANGQCSQCMVLADGKPVKSCMELVKDNMKVMPVEGLVELPEISKKTAFREIEEIETPVLIIGGGPAGLSAAIELGKLGISAILIDDKHRFGGKLVLQTHRFFGSSSAVYAGTRGIDIATILENEIKKYACIQMWPQATALAVFKDKKVGILRGNDEYMLIKPNAVLVATGAREKFLAIQGNSLPGVFGAGAFQTLVNRDLVKPSEKLFIVGGGNVGLIAGYHALQAGIGVVGLVEAALECGGYKVHKDKLVRMGVPIYTSHTILSANGKDHVESVTIAEVDENFLPIPGTEKSFECDSVLIAVGLEPVDEFFHKSEKFEMNVFSAGDAQEIAEASAAIFSGKIKGLEVAKSLGANVSEIPTVWYRMSEILKSRPGKSFSEELPEVAEGVIPVIHCTQEIPCDPCTQTCDHGMIDISATDIRGVPQFIGDNYCCEACEKCVAGCPGLAITLVDYRENPDFPFVSIPYEFLDNRFETNQLLTALDTQGNLLGNYPLINIHDDLYQSDHTLVLVIQAPSEIAPRISGVRIQEPNVTEPMDHYVEQLEDDTIICRCERVTAGEIRSLIRSGVRDINEIKSISRAGMGACGGRTCSSLINRIFREEGIDLSEVTPQSKRPLFVEVPLGTFAGHIHSEDGSDD